MWYKYLNEDSVILNEFGNGLKHEHLYNFIFLTTGPIIGAGLSTLVNHHRLTALRERIGDKLSDSQYRKFKEELSSVSDYSFAANKKKTIHVLQKYAKIARVDIDSSVRNSHRLVD